MSQRRQILHLRLESMVLEAILLQGGIQSDNICLTRTLVRNMYISLLLQKTLKKATENTQDKATFYFSGTYILSVLGDCRRVCQYCATTFWHQERSKYFGDARIHYNKCCNNGKGSIQPTTIADVLCSYQC